MIYGIVYCITNVVNGKKYIGKTTSTIERRWYFHKRYAEKGSSTALHGAIRKYGKDGFELSILDVARSEEELSQKEVFHVARLETLVPGGYNLTIGGEGSSGYKATDSTKRKISIVRSSMPSRPISRETRTKISNSMRHACCRQGHPFDTINTYVHKSGARRCWTCYYLNRHQKLPEKFKPYLKES
jgi:group I intron endonuclease